MNRRQRRWAARSGVTVLAVGLLMPATRVPARAADATCTGQRDAPVYVPETSAALTALGDQAVWGLATGQGVTVAVVDSGIDTRNAHLPADSAVLAGQTFVEGVGQWTPDPAGRNDRSGHGTAVASLIAGRPVQGSGQVGLAKDAELLPMQVYNVSEDQRGGGDPLDLLLPRTDRLAAGIRAAAERGAKVINVSVSLDRPDQALADAVTFADARGALVVASAGDRATGANKADGPRYPAAFPNVVSVTALTSTGAVDTANTIQGEHITVAAAGQGLTIAFGDKGDCVPNGATATGYATPLVAATAALIAQRYPGETPALWKYRIEASALRPRADVKDAALGWGILSPYGALTMTLDPNRPGPAMPGHPAPPRSAQQEGAGPVELEGDPEATNRQIGIWMAFVTAAGAGGLSLVRILRRGRGRGPAPALGLDVA